MLHHRRNARDRRGARVDQHLHSRSQDDARLVVRIPGNAARCFRAFGDLSRAKISAALRKFIEKGLADTLDE
jgi:hypothetical protein